jgi:hypothetical protein
MLGIFTQRPKKGIFHGLAHEHECRSNHDGGTSELTHVFEVYDLFAVKTRTLPLMVTWLTRSTF